MKLLVLFLLSLATSFAAEETCAGRCQNGFDPKQKCQCDNLCKYYGSCCADYDSECRTKITRGDVFNIPNENVTSSDLVNIRDTTTDPKKETCSGNSFDALMEIKNGSVYAFRGEYFFELDEKSVLPGYPKLIKDVWGMSGPIDAAFTRINCQGKSYILKGDKYWRFDGHVLDEDYPRDISVGFENIPDDVDAVFAIPAAAYHKKEKVYFFKGDQYYQYEFRNQPSHEDCVRIAKSSPSVLFTRYTDLYNCDYDWDDLFTSLFQDPIIPGYDKSPRLIARDWVGIRPPIDAAMMGRMYLSSKPSPSLPVPSSSSPVGQDRRGRYRGGRRKKGKGRVSDAFDLFDLDLDTGERRVKNKKKGHGRSFDSYSYEYTDYTDLVEVPAKSTPVQKVYFFQKDKYYRVDLQTKRIDYVNPPYPRSISKYWLGCKVKDLAEKR